MIQKNNYLPMGLILFLLIAKNFDNKIYFLQFANNRILNLLFSSSVICHVTSISKHERDWQQTKILQDFQ